MSSPNRRMSPGIFASGTSSCMRLRERRKVDLPQPLGPMMAVTARARTSRETLLRTWLAPNQTERLRIVKASAVGAVAADAAGVTAGAGVAWAAAGPGTD